LQNPRISIVIPTLHEGKLIAQTLNQFTEELRRTHRLEVIVSDGGSADETIGVARAHADSLITNESGLKQTISIGRNAGARVARGDILMFINADTLIDDIASFFPAMCNIMDRRDIAAATCKVRVYRSEESFLDRLFHGFYNLYFWLLNITGVGMGRGECQVVRRELFWKAGGYNEAIAAGEDFDLFVRLRREGKIAFFRSLTVRESPRRYRKYGYLWITLLWFINAVAVLVLHRSVADHWKPVR